MKKSHVVALLILLVVGLAAFLWGGAGIVSLILPKETLTVEEYLARFGETATGTIRTGSDRGTVILSGRKVNLKVEIVEGSAKVPAGAWRVKSWSFTAAEPGKAESSAKGTVPRGKGTFEVQAGVETSLPVGEPFKAVLEYRRDGGQYLFSQRLEGAYGEAITVARVVQQSRMGPPSLHIWNDDGTYDRVLPFQYG